MQGAERGQAGAGTSRELIDALVATPLAEHAVRSKVFRNVRLECANIGAIGRSTC